HLREHHIVGDEPMEEDPEEADSEEDNTDEEDFYASGSPDEDWIAEMHMDVSFETSVGVHYVQG
ncbi:hypothetical protein PIB30_097483, partial [Stylosanthes scabra]|nr:hypothetical protein [Stylosanthes scabra]